MDAGASSIDKRLINQPVTLNAPLPRNALRHDMNPEMRLSARPMARMAFVLVQFVDDVEALRRESAVKLFVISLLYGHDGGISPLVRLIGKGRVRPRSS